MPSDTTRFRTGKNGRYLFTVFEPNEEGETSRLWEQELPIANEHGKEVGNVAVAVKQVAALDKAWTLVKSVLLKSGQTLAGEDVPSIDRSENSTRGGPQLSGDSGDSDESGKLRLSGWSVINHSREESKTGSWSVVEEPS
jgi:hypothetical protein